jgi:hypothetical protein
MDSDAWQKFDPTSEDDIQRHINDVLDCCRQQLEQHLSPCELAFAEKYWHRVHDHVELQIRRQAAQLVAQAARANTDQGHEALARWAGCYPSGPRMPSRRWRTPAAGAWYSLRVSWPR